jgi:HrpA-like RNA helicase
MQRSSLFIFLIAIFSGFMEECFQLRYYIQK